VGIIKEQGHQFINLWRAKIIKEPHILDLIDIGLLQNVQDFFATTMDVASISVDENGPITNPSNFTDFCINYTRCSELGLKRCFDCDLKGGEAAAKKGEPVIYTCHAGLTDFAVPIMIEGKHVATILGGQVLTETPNEEHFSKVARDLGLDEEEYIKQVQKIKIVPLEKITAAAQFLFQLTNSLSAIAYANFKLSEVGLNYKMLDNIKLENLFFANHKKLTNAITDREFEVLKLIVLGKNNNEIANELFISVHTAKKHVSSILQKLLVEDRVQVAVKAVRERLV
jgi:ligand-binding sensor protein/DNA-binding CsgD family transcriptional regulator